MDFYAPKQPVAPYDPDAPATPAYVQMKFLNDQMHYLIYQMTKLTEGVIETNALLKQMLPAKEDWRVTQAKQDAHYAEMRNEEEKQRWMQTVLDKLDSIKFAVARI